MQSLNFYIVLFASLYPTVVSHTPTHYTPDSNPAACVPSSSVVFYPRLSSPAAPLAPGHPDPLRNIILISLGSADSFSQEDVDTRLVTRSWRRRGFTAASSA